MISFSNKYADIDRYISEIISMYFCWDKGLLWRWAAAWKRCFRITLPLLLHCSTPCSPPLSAATVGLLKVISSLFFPRMFCLHSNELGLIIHHKVLFDCLLCGAGTALLSYHWWTACSSSGVVTAFSVFQSERVNFALI